MSGIEESSVFMLGQYICMLFLVCVLCNVLYIRSLVVLVWCYALCACVLCTHISVFLCINFNIMCHVLRFNVIASKFLIFSMCAVGHSHVVVHVWCLYGCAHFVSLVHFHAGGSQIAAQKLYSTCVVSSQVCKVHTYAHMYAHTRYIHTCIHIHTYENACIHICMHTCMYVYTHTCTHVHVRTYMHVCTCLHIWHTSTHLWMHAHTNSIHTRTHLRSNAYTHTTHTHTHTHTPHACTHTLVFSTSVLYHISP